MTHAKEVKRLSKAVRKWPKILGLETWELRFEYHDGVFISPDGSSSTDATATTNVQWEYQQAIINFNTQRTARYDDAELDYCVVHELCHCLLNEMRTLIPDGFYFSNDDHRHEERVVTIIARAIMRATGQQAEWIQFEEKT